ncbi:MAG TPA: M20/M25/M40 family metallo-hydrolase [Methylomirabilota bacterium]|nr:M20/M25/M40 family metallo-hydrolase [Methylomirabilota bacterium]
MHAAVQLLRELIAIPSVNPAFLPPGDARTGEEPVAAHLEGIARRSGLATERQSVAKGRSNLIIRATPKDKVGRRLLLAPHLDTVGEPALDALLQPRIVGDKLFGRGACDTKGSVAAMFTALLSFASLPAAERTGTEVIFVGLVDEEDGQSGSRALSAAKFKADFALVGEPTELRLVTAHKGDLWLKLVTRGKAAHGSKPHLGRNAVHEMARIVHLLETSYARILKRRRHPLLGSPTVNVGMIHGGAQPNIVPDECSIVLDRRTIPGERDSQVKREILALIREHGFKAALEDTKAGECRALETSLSNTHVRAFLEILKQKQAVGVDFFCDAAVLAAGGIPSAVFGPGSISDAHTSNEYISMKQLVAAHDLLLRWLCSANH